MPSVVLRGSPLRIPTSFYGDEEDRLPTQPSLVEIRNVPDLLRSLREYFTGEENYSDVLLLIREAPGVYRRYGRVPTATSDVLEACKRNGYFEAVEGRGEAYQVEIVEGPEAGKGRHLILLPMRAPEEVPGILVLPLRWAPNDLAEGHLARIRTLADLAGTLLHLRRRTVGDRALTGGGADLIELLERIRAGLDGIARTLERPARPPGPGDLEASLEEARRGTADLEAMIDDALHLVRLDEGHIPWNREPVDLLDLFDRVRGRLHEAARKKEVEIVVRSRGLRLRVLADSALLEETIQDLTAFALETSLDRQTLSVRLAARHDAGVQICIWIPKRRIEPDRLGTLFEPWRMRLPGLRRWGPKLAAAKKVVERHGGRLWVESTSPEGTRIFLLLPPAPRAGSGSPTHRGSASQVGPRLHLDHRKLQA